MEFNEKQFRSQVNEARNIENIKFSHCQFVAGFTFTDSCGRMAVRHKPNNCYLLGETYLDKKVFPSFPYANSGWFVSQQPGKALF